MREIKLLYKLDHPNIMKLYESIDSLNSVHLVTEYIEGFSLHEYLKSQNGSKLPESEARQIVQ